MEPDYSDVHPPVVDLPDRHSIFPPTPKEHTVLLGFDGFIDTIYTMVDTRTSPQSYKQMQSLQALGDKISASASQASSLTIEWKPQSIQPGGFTIHCGDALTSLGTEVIYFGTYGRPTKQIFQSLTESSELITVGEPTETSAVEFNDGKLILINPRSQIHLDWSTLMEQAPRSCLLDRIKKADIMGLGTWGKIPQMPTIWREMEDKLLENVSDPPNHILIDLGNIRMLTTSAIRSGSNALFQLNETIPVTLSGNRGEIHRLAEALSNTSFDSFLAAAETVRNSIGIERVIGHNSGTIVMSTSSRKETITPPVISAPTRLLSAGDRFNAGLIYGILTGLSEKQLLSLGDLVARYYIQTGLSLTHPQLRQLI